MAPRDPPGLTRRPDATVPLLRITSPPDLTDLIVTRLERDAGADDVSVVLGASRTSGGDLILAEVPRAAIDQLLAEFPHAGEVRGLYVAVEPSERLVPVGPDRDTDREAVIWAQVVQDIHAEARLSWINIALIVNAAAIAAIGLIEDQLLLIVGAMALSPDYFPIADTCLAAVRRDGRRFLLGLRTLLVSYGAGALGAYLLTEFLTATGIAQTDAAPDRSFTLFISQPDALSVVVALLAGVAGALAITLADARGLVGVFVSVTTIPAAANIGVALAGDDPHAMAGAAVQLGVNVLSLLVAGTVTLEVRRRLRRAAPIVTRAVRR